MGSPARTRLVLAVGPSMVTISSRTANKGGLPAFAFYAGEVKGAKGGFAPAARRRSFGVTDLTAESIRRQRWPTGTRQTKNLSAVGA
jgi:hypothetical protein